MILFPNAKINLGLRILQKRHDGFHNIETCFYPIPWRDGLEIIKAKKSRFSSSGLPIPGDPSENICFKAYRLFRKDFNLPNVHIHLHKVIPIGAGLGGGSSDAAHTLKLLSEQFNLILDEELLQIYAEQLGSDCAFFIENTPAMGFNKGEELKPIKLSLKGKYLMVIYPNIHVSTAEAYECITPKYPESKLETILTELPVSAWKEQVENDFEAGIFNKYPKLGEVKQLLYDSGALFASMTGSGSCLYGIFEKEVKIQLPVPCLSWSGYL